jgi:hypothetical protein
VTLKPEFTAALQENVWIGMKLISWNDPHDTQRVIHRLYLDTDPFDLSTGLPKTIGAYSANTLMWKENARVSTANW